MLDALAAVSQLALYAGVLSASGAVFAQATLQLPSSGVLARCSRWGAALTILATCGGAVVLIYRLGGQFDEATISAVLMSSVGAAAGLRISAAALLLTTLSSTADSFMRGMRLSYAVLLASSFIFSGHAAATGFVAGLIAAVHICLAGWWIASLIAMEQACAHAPPAEAADLVRRFSALAVAAIAALIVAGIIMILTLVDLPVLEVTPYLKILGVKIALALAVFALASYNKWRLTQDVLANNVAAIRKLRSSIQIELLLIGAVLVATAILTTYTSPDD